MCEMLKLLYDVLIEQRVCVCVFLSPWSCRDGSETQVSASAAGGTPRLLELLSPPSLQIGNGGTQILTLQDLCALSAAAYASTSSQAAKQRPFCVLEEVLRRTKRSRIPQYYRRIWIGGDKGDPLMHRPLTLPEEPAALFITAPTSAPQRRGSRCSSRRPLMRFPPSDLRPPAGPTEAGLLGKDINGASALQRRHAQFLPEISSVLRRRCNEIHKRVSRG